MSKVVWLVAAASIVLTYSASAQDFCIPPAIGVPTRPGPPTWWVANDPLAPNGPAVDDPRWQGAAGTTFTSGGAEAPFALRALQTSPLAIFGVGGGSPTAQNGSATVATNYLMSFQSSIDPNPQYPHDLFIGIRRPGTHITTSTVDPAAYIIQLHVAAMQAASTSTPSTPAYCPSPTSTTAACNFNANYYVIWEDNIGSGTTSTPGTCNGTNGELFVPTTTLHDIPWLDNVATFFELGSATAGTNAFTANSWAAEVALPILDASAGSQTLDKGIEAGATIWYEGAQDASTSATQAALMNLGQWPDTTSASGICLNTGSFIPQLVDPDLIGSANYGAMAPTALAGSAGCEAGLQIQSQNIGTIHNGSAGSDFADASLSTVIYGTGWNTFVAQVHNTGMTPITTPLLGRFRLASWGAVTQFMTPGQWIDIRGAENGVCSVPPSPSAVGCGTGTIQPGENTAIHFNFTVGSGSSGASEFCQYGLTPPGDTCGSCSCGSADGSFCYATTDTGTQSVDSTGAKGMCVTAYQEHQCVEVELSVPTGSGSNTVTFVQQSAWNNLNFAQMSINERTAVIDVRGLPKPPGNAIDQNVYLLVMPRNMPGTLPAGTTGLSLITSNALARAKAIAQLYSPQKIPPQDGAAIEKIDSMAKEVNAGDEKTIAALLNIAHATGTASDTTQAAFAALGGAQAATILPTLEIYAFYESSPHVWSPMTSFTVFLSHEGGLTGIHYEIDGATKIANNIYQLRVPVNHAREIRIRSQAITSGEAVEPPGEARWPCSGGGCCSHNSGQCGIVAELGNTGPAVLVGMVFLGRGRRRRDKRA